MCLPLGIYGAVCAHLGEPLAYPSDLTSWEITECQSSAMLNAYLMEWVVLTDAVRNEAWVGMECGIPDMDPGVYSERTYPHDPSPRGRVPSACIAINLVKL